MAYKFTYLLANKIQNLGLRIRLIAERLRSSRAGWTSVPSVIEILGRPHRFEVILFCQRFLSPRVKYTLVDVGANVGDWGARYCKHIACNYYAFEPDPRAYRLLVANTPFGHHAEMAVGETISDIELHLAPSSTYSSRYDYDSRIERIGDLSRVTVKQVTLDTQNLPTENLIVKIDVQGAEMDVLRGGTSTLRHASLLILEVPLFPQTTGDNSLSSLVSTLSTLGFIPVYFCQAGVPFSKNTIPVEHDIIFLNPQKIDPLKVLT